MSLQAIRDWMTRHPERRQAAMNRNPSYVFFRELTGDGPVGAQGVVLTPGRSLAVDRRHLPLGAPLWVDVAYPSDTRQTGSAAWGERAGTSLASTVAAGSVKTTNARYKKTTN